MITTIIIPIGKGQSMLCLDSLQTQNINKEIIPVVGELEVVKDRGKCLNMEKAKEYAIREYILLCDSDVDVSPENIVLRCMLFLNNNPQWDGVAVDTKGYTDQQLETIDKQEKNRHINCAFILMRSEAFKKIDFTFTEMCICMNFNQQSKICYLDYTTHLKEIPR
jgi:hypothetical protein